MTDFTATEIAPGISVYSHHVEKFSDVLPDGRLYFVTTNEHFAVRIAGLLFHGTIGEIIEDRAPTKIRECRFGGTCGKRATCQFYHDPLKHNTSTDKRNFIASSFLYQPGSTRACARKIGSKKNLATDIQSATDDDVNLFCDQVMHDLLCAIVAKQMRVSTRVEVCDPPVDSYHTLFAADDHI